MNYNKMYRVVKLVNGLYQVQGKQTEYSDWDTMSWNRMFSGTDWANNRDGYASEKQAMNLLNKILTRLGGAEVAEVIWPKTTDTPEIPNRKEKTFVEKIIDMFG